MPAAAQAQQKNNIALVGMILGIAGIVLIWIPYISILGILSAIVGLILSAIGKSKANKTGVGGGMAVAGLICSIIALALIVVVIILVVSIGFAMFG
jgi:hypothetical protein